MKLAYVDTSYLVAIAFGEPGAGDLAARMKGFDGLFSSNLLEAEFRSALLREQVCDPGRHFLSWLTWIFPDRPLTREIDRIAAVGYLRGADLWHLANALFLAPRGRELTFLTADRRQAEIAKKLDFA
ncbi:MAG: PIN domain-containing protein [Acidobacteriota bacterium]